MVDIKLVQSNSDLKKFIKFPHSLYSGNPQWVPPLIMDEINTLRKDKNPVFEHSEANYWLAYKDGKIAGRIAGLINHKYNEVNNFKHARFGWIDFIDDEEVSQTLIETVENWAREKGMTHIHGPLGFCDLDRQGMLLEGYDDLGMLITIYNYPYYPVHLEKLGYQKDIDWVEFELKVPESIPEKLERINEIVLKRSKLRILDVKKPKEFLPYAEGLFELMEEAYKDLYGAVPLNEKQVESYIKQYFGFVNPNFVKIILDNDDKIAAFGITMPSLSTALQKTGGRLFPFGFISILKAIKKNDRLDLYLVAVRPDLQGKGVTALLLTEINKAAIKHGIKYAETGPELENNSKVQALWKFFEVRQHKRRRCFIKEL
ncbi:MAG: GNAT family N-acetyltransferase [Eubacteriales bacterium]|nr:GNAT family N-acetyltransferase [Eubacteriales bacterium]